MTASSASFTVDPAALRRVGAGLNRPECVLAVQSGYVVVPDWSGAGGVAVIGPDGRVGRVQARGFDRPLRANGIALEPGGAVIVAQLGPDDGGVFRLRPDGAVEPVVTEVDGVALPPTNFVLRDAAGRLWITVSTRRRPRHLGFRPDVDDGFGVLAAARGARIVADGLGYTNECLLSPDGATLWVNETFGRRLSAFDVMPDGDLRNRRTVNAFGPGTYPDGLALDVEGGLWVTSPVSNRIVRVDRDGRATTVLEDADTAHVAEVERAWRDGAMGRPHLDKVTGAVLKGLSSLAFGGSDLRTAYLGCLQGDHIHEFTAPVAGVPPSHWRTDLGPLARLPESSA
jgi:sugar lactone lactonase YvrE